WDLDTFFKINTNAASGFVPGSDHALSGALGQSLDAIFDDATFGASAESFVITNFTFTPEGGVESITAAPVALVPEPTPWMLMLAAMLVLYVGRTRRFAAIARRS